MSNNLYTHPYKHLRSARTVFCALVALVLCIASIVPKSALADLYTVEGIDVDVTAKNALEAREKAFSEAQVKAYETLSERLVNSGEQSAVQELDAETISFMVQDFEVTKEQLSAKRYKGTYTIRFNPDSFQQQVINQGQSYSDIPRGSVLVLPFYQTGSNTVLWDSTNPFLSAWARSREINGEIASTVVPIGDIEDVSQINEFSPLNYDPVKLERMRDRYGANEVSIILASPEVGMSGVGNVRLSLYSARIRGPEFSGQMTIEGNAGETTAQLYDRVVSKIKQQYKSDWKQETAVASMDTQSFPAVMSFTSVREWIDAKQKLERVPGMASVIVNRLTPREASMALNYQGDVQRLAIALERSGLRLAQSANGYQTVYYIMRIAPQYQQQAPQTNQTPYNNPYNRSYYQ